MYRFDKNPCMDFKGELCSERNATQRNATQRNATQRNATQRNATQRNATQRKFYHCISKRKSFSESPV